MEQLIAQFIAVMQEEKAIYEELLSLSVKKKDAVLAKDVNDLDAIVRQEQGVILRLGQCEKRRLHCIGLFCKETNFPPETVTMLKFAQAATPEQNLQIHALNDSLSGILKQLSDKNQANRALLESRLEYVHFAMDMLTAKEDSGVYNMGGYGSGLDSEPQRSGKTIIDRKV